MRALSLWFSVSFALVCLAVKHKHLSQTIKQLATISDVFEVAAEQTKQKNEGKKEKLVHFHCRFLQKSQRETETKMPPQSLIVPIAQ